MSWGDQRGIQPNFDNLFLFYLQHDLDKITGDPRHTGTLTSPTEALDIFSVTRGTCRPAVYQKNSALSRINRDCFFDHYLEAATPVDPRPTIITQGLRPCREDRPVRREQKDARGPGSGGLSPIE